MAGELILVVEDNERNLRLVRDVLHHGGYRTVEASTGADGVALALRHEPDLVLMDVQLPDIDGIEALSRLRQAPETASLPVVAVTAFAMKNDRARFLAAGFDGYLEKPISVQLLPAQVQQFLTAREREGPR